ncbi:TRAP transporter substrate-binding protein DctP [Rhizobium sp. FKY42]|uniref:TRAP transporter substrate-binding protein DctP n=1 Tax=Rhizobium sp. FKY42 TaxID=2562310 RepID=UPI001484D94B|nr:TRAP transporter substrate-binding protein DctP [Rhizobium sp. FKY42]
MGITLRLITAALAVAVSAVSVHAATFRIATNVTEDSTAGKLLAEFSEAVTARTEGRVKFKMFHNGVLGEQAQYLQQIQTGAIDAGLVNSGTLETVVPAVGVMNLPYAFRSSEEYAKVMTDPNILKTLETASRAQKINVLGFLSSGFRSIYTTKPVKDFAGLKGLKLRSIASPTYTEMVSLFGAVPTPLPFGELYSGLQAGVVDGAEGGLAGLWVAKFGEVAKYALVTNHTRLTDFIVTSAEFNEKVGKQDLALLQEEFQKVSLKSIKFADQTEADQLAQAVAKLGVTVTQTDLAPFMAAVSPMYEKARGDAAKRPMIEALFTATGR